MNSIGSLTPRARAIGSLDELYLCSWDRCFEGIFFFFFSFPAPIRRPVTNPAHRSLNFNVNSPAASGSLLRERWGCPGTTDRWDPLWEEFRACHDRDARTITSPPPRGGSGGKTYNVAAS